MFNIQTEAHLRRTYLPDSDCPDRLTAALIAATLILWTAIIIAAI